MGMLACLISQHKSHVKLTGLLHFARAVALICASFKLF